MLYRVTVTEPGRVTARVSDEDGVDIDVHILTAPSGSGCLDRDNVEASAEDEDCDGTASLPHDWP